MDTKRDSESDDERPAATVSAEKAPGGSTEEARIARLIFLRGQLRSQLTQRGNYILSLKNISTVKIYEDFLGREQRLKRTFEKFEAVQDSLDASSPAEIEGDYRATVEDSYMRVLAHLRVLFNSYTGKSRQGPSTSDSTPPDIGVSGTSGSATQQMPAQQTSVSDQLIRKRNLLKSQLAQGRDSLLAFEVTTPSSHRELRSRLQLFKGLFERYSSAQDSIDLIQVSDLELEERANVEAAYFQALGVCEDRLESLQAQVAGTLFPGFSLPGPLIPTQPHIKLPELKLPSFNGDPAKWLEFRDTFHSVVGSQARLTNVDKFQYLKSCLTSEASLVLQNISVSEANFSVAWTTLRQRFDNPRLIANTHIDKLFNPPVLEKNSSESLRAFLDHFISNCNALDALQLEVHTSDLLISKMILDRLPPKFIRDWEDSISPDVIPSLKDLLAFVERRVRTLQMTAVSSSLDASPQPPSTVASKQFTPKPTGSKNPSSSRNCPCCNNGVHDLFRCATFRSWDVPTRSKYVTEQHRCRVCLRAGSHASCCQTFLCGKCRQRHSTWLHKDPQADPAPKTANTISSHEVRNSPHPFLNAPHASGAQLLATAVVRLSDNFGNVVEATALLDTGADCNLVSEHLISKLKIVPQDSSVQLEGILSDRAVVSQTVALDLKSIPNTWATSIAALIVPEVSPLRFSRQRFDIHDWDLPLSIAFADPNFNVPKRVDLLLGAAFCSAIQCSGRISPPHFPTLQNSQLGWYLFGELPSHATTSRGGSRAAPASDRSREDPRMAALVTADRSLTEQVNNFWQLEAVHTSPPYAEHAQCEAHFSRTVARDATGRYIVRLPYKSDVRDLGVSRPQAQRRFTSLEKRLSADDELRKAYLAFMLEYQALGHMSLVEAHTAAPSDYFIPHHPVFKPSSTTTKLRVVFDASAVTSNGKSLNDLLLSGPVVQADLFTILLRFRLNPIAFMADMVKMYRQVLIHPEDRFAQQIFWRNSPQDPLQVYTLNTVTYGTTSGAFLATRALQQLARDEGQSFPLAATIIDTAVYMDDVISGAQTLEEARQAVAQLQSLLPKGGFELHKWCSNSVELLADIPVEFRETQRVRTFGQSDTAVVKALGLIWETSSDLLRIETASVFQGPPARCTRRTLLSGIASIFDPLGLISPLVAKCKILFQEVWKTPSGWDDPLPAGIVQRWCAIHGELKHISRIAIPRLAILPKAAPHLQLHGFCDASQVAYGACLYLHSSDSHGNVVTNLLCSKAKVAPCKPTTIPRLELLAAHLLAALVDKVVQALSGLVFSVFLWSDSQIVLSWIARSPTTLKVFVANRIADIQDYTGRYEWRHVPTGDNPADLISRGLMPRELINNTLWWSGPDWLSQDRDHWPQRSLPSVPDLPELRQVHLLTVSDTFASAVTAKLPHLRTIRVMAYVLRFIHNAHHPSSKLVGPLLPADLQRALHACVQLIQAVAYPTELRALSDDQPLSKHSRIWPLSPFRDTNGLLCVGGRLQHSALLPEAKHQKILPADHPFVRHMIRYIHFRYDHAQLRALIAHVREQFWIPGLRLIVRTVIRHCNTCFRLQAKPPAQLMGDLPSTRVLPSAPFYHVSVDYAGPMLIRDGGPRSKVLLKAYVAVFVCHSTKAIHIELVTALTSCAFLAALSRFTGRRGLPASITSDNGTNFVGACADLKRFQKVFASKQHHQIVQDATSQSHIQWNFLPPCAPHQGGLHESAVKSLKQHLRRLTTGVIFNFEEMYTLLIHIEAVLNSHPLVPLFEDTSDVNYLSPGHFLIGRPLMSLPVHDFADTTDLRSRWQMVQRLTTALWRTWSRDYLQLLQRRGKWATVTPNLQVGMVVLVMEDNVSPLKWILGVIHAVHPGADGLVRVATVRTPTGLYKRPLVKLCPLPSCNKPPI